MSKKAIEAKKDFRLFFKIEFWWSWNIRCIIKAGDNIK